MVEFKKKRCKNVLKVVARSHGIPVTEVRADIQATIESARNNPDPEKQAEFKKFFGDMIPTPEEFIFAMTKKLKNYGQ